MLKHVKIVILLDKSGSMASVADQTIAGFNSFIKEQQSAQKAKVRLSLAAFNDGYTSVYKDIPLRKAKPLSPSNYQPNGLTSLLDAIGITILNLAENTPNLPPAEMKILVAIITDGLENNSTKFTRPQIFDMIRYYKQHHNWQFIFLGANQDAIQEAACLGISEKRSLTYAHDQEGVQHMFSAVSHNIISCCLNDTEFEFTNMQRKSQQR